MIYRISKIDSKEDQERFIQKFGKDNFDIFNSLKGRMQNQNISTDIVWHVKYTSVEEMDKMLKDLIDRVAPEHDKYDEVYSDDRWDVLKINNWQTAMYYGDGTVWCITGRYDRGYPVKPSQAKYYFNEYLKKDYSAYYFIFDKEKKTKYCLCILKDGKNYNLWTAKDVVIRKIKGFPHIDGLPDITSTENDDFEIDEHILVRYRGNAEEVTIPKEIYKIGMNAFFGNTDIKRVKMKAVDGINTISGWAFCGCRNLTSVFFSINLDSLRVGAFSECTSLTDVFFSDKLTYIGISCFENCTKLRTAMIGKNIKELMSYTFKGCSSLEKVTSNADGSNVIKGIERVRSGCFEGCTSLRSIVFEQSLERIEDYAFRDCNNLRNIVIPKNCLVDEHAFPSNVRKYIKRI